MRFVNHSEFDLCIILFDMISVIIWNGKYNKELVIIF